MKIRTQDQLFDRIARERIWRIREISSLRAMCSSRSLQYEAGRAARRSFVPIAYAHWEGFVKKTSHYYLEFVSMQGLKLNQLSASFMSLYLWSENSEVIKRGKNFSLVDVCDALISGGERQVYIKYRDAIPRIGNVNSELLRDICRTLGIDYRDFEARSFFLDSGLVGRRNNIAHGEEQDIEASDLEGIKDGVVGLIDTFRFKVEEAASSFAYRR